jgi:general secretion pathway protein L
MSIQLFLLPTQGSLNHDAPLTLSGALAGARVNEVWAVVPAAALSWHRISLPAGLQRSPAKLKAALTSMMEEPLLDDTEQMHLALQPQWQDESSVWVAACNKPWLQSHLSQLQSLGHIVHRIVPEWAPSLSSTSSSKTSENVKTASAPLSVWFEGTPEDAWLSVCDSNSAWRLPLAAGLQFWIERLNAAFRAEDEIRAFSFQADPAVADLAQQSLYQLKAQANALTVAWLEGCRVEVVTAQQRYANTAASQWDLAQFEFAAHGSARWLQRSKRMWHNFTQDKAWRPARWSLIILIFAQWLGLNVSAWQLNAQIKAQRDLQKSIFTQTFPNVPLVDASLQMSNELLRLQRNSGTLSPRDLESVLDAVGQALPSDQAVTHIDYQAQGASETRLQGLTLSGDTQNSFVQSLRSKSYDAQLSGTQWRITHKQEGR